MLARVSLIAAITAVSLACSSCQTTPSSESAALRAYEADLYARAEPVWLRLATAHSKDLAPGIVHVLFKIYPDGHVTDARVTTNSGNHVLAEIALQTVHSTRFAPLSPTLLAILHRGYLPADCDFKTYL